MEDDFDVLDPHPNIHGLFLHYNDLYFDNSLGACTVEWSTARMTLCAGQCHLIPSGGCRIRLSQPLLQYRPSRDLKDVLLHEIIHAEIFLSGQRDTDGDHGSLFQARMRAINASTVPDSQRPPGGYNITTHHRMHAEVAVFRTHVWRCSSCGNTTRRSTNRRPQEADCRSYSKAKAAAAAEAGRPAGSYCSDERCWYHGHIRSCGGEFIKIAEPEKPQAAAGAAAGGSNKRSRKQPAAAPAHTPPITAFFHHQQQQQQTNKAQQLPGSSGSGGRQLPHAAAAGGAAAPPAPQQQHHQQHRGAGAAAAAAGYWSGLGSGHRLGGRPTEALYPPQQQQQPVQQQRPAAAAAAGSEVVELLSSSEDGDDDAGDGDGDYQPGAEGRGRPADGSGGSKRRGHMSGSSSGAGPSPSPAAAAAAAVAGRDGGGGGGWMCPVCCEQFAGISNAQLNAHLDKCLALMHG